jgi:hypothetical protein
MNSSTALFSTAPCAQCGAPLSSGSTEGLCPRCLLRAGLASGSVSGAGTCAVVPPPEFPFDFGGYRLLRLLGRGGMGAVYEAEDTASGRRIALKVLGHSLDSPDTRKRFLREGRLAASINHPNSVYVYGTEEIDGTPVITMELVPGGTLHDRVKTGGPLPIGEAVDAVLQIIAGLEAAHGAGILHRDIKPSNCFVDPSGVVKIGDFGLSISTLSRGDSALTVAGSVLGTPDFCSPEQLRGEALDVRSDIYSVGVTLYHLLTGRTPFQAENMVALLATVLEKPAPSPRTHRPEIPGALARVILRCLAKPAGDRFRGYDELRRALLPFGTTAPTPATLALRFVAGFIDHFVYAAINMLVPLLVVGDLVAVSDPATFRTPQWMGVAVGLLLFQLAYYAVPEGRWGASLGKALVGLRVGGLDRQAPGIPRAALRAVIYLLPTILGFLRFRHEAEAVQITALNVALGFAVLFYPALLCVTARRRNGYATLTDLLTGTRVFQRSAWQPRETLAQADEPAPATEALPQVGPYHVLAPQGGLLLGYDTRLLRRVWIRQVPAGTPSVAFELRQATRPGRLRWLQGRRDETGGWDAYEAVPGSPLTALLSQPQPWKAVRHWLHDLATELATATHDGSRPVVLSLDRVWITADGRAKLLDFPAPGAGVAPEIEPEVFLNQIALSALEGRLATAEEARAVPARVPVPIRARGVLQVLRGADFSALVPQLQALVRQVPEVTRRRRLGIIAGFVGPALIVTGFMFAGTKLLDIWRRQLPEVLPLRNALTQHYVMGLRPVQLDAAGKPLRDALEIYIAGRFGDFIRDPEKWHSRIATSVILPAMRKEAERIVAAHPSPSAQEREAARVILGDRLVIPGIENAPEGSAESRPDPKQISPPSMVGLTFLGTFVWGAFFSLIAALFRGGLLLRAFGVAVVRGDGLDASRGRILWRTCLAWSWLPVSGLIVAFLTPASLAGAVGVAVMLCGGAIVWSAALPQRSLPDRLAGTWLVPR